MKVWRTVGVLVGVGVVAAGVVLASGDGSEAQAAQAAPAVTGCAIRFGSGGPAIHENSTHTCTGATSVSVEGDGDLMIKSTPRGPIISMTVEEDETLARRGIIAGPSGGVSTTVVRFYSTKTGAALRADSSQLQGSNANIWVTWVNGG